MVSFMVITFRHLSKFRAKVSSTPRSFPCKVISTPRSGHFNGKVIYYLPWLGMPQDLVNKMSVTCQGQFHAKVSSKPRSVPRQGQLHAMISETQGSSH